MSRRRLSGSARREVSSISRRGYAASVTSSVASLPSLPRRQRRRGHAPPHRRRGCSRPPPPASRAPRRARAPCGARRRRIRGGPTVSRCGWVCSGRCRAAHCASGRTRTCPASRSSPQWPSAALSGAMPRCAARRAIGTWRCGTSRPGCARSARSSLTRMTPPPQGLVVGKADDFAGVHSLAVRRCARDPR